MLMQDFMTVGSPLRAPGDWIQQGQATQTWLGGSMVVSLAPNIHMVDYSVTVTAVGGGVVTEWSNQVSPPGTPNGLIYGFVWDGTAGNAGGGVIAAQGADYTMTVSGLETMDPSAGGGDNGGGGGDNGGGDGGGGGNGGGNGNGRAQGFWESLPMWAKVGGGLLVLSTLTGKS